MYKLAIIDDEKKFVRLLQALIDWEALPLHLVGTAHNGPDGRALIEATNPDIILMDIRMPGFDGIEVIHQLRDQGYQGRFIVISGHRQFDYARNAIRLGVEDFLLKPVQKDELNTILGKLIQELEQEVNHQKKIQKSTRILQEQMASEFISLFKDGKLTRDLIENRLGEGKRFGSDLQFVLFFIKNDLNIVPAQSREQLLLRQKTEAIIHRRMTEQNLDYFADDDHGVHQVLTIHPALTQIDFGVLLHTILEDIYTLKDVFFSLESTIILGKPITGLETSSSVWKGCSDWLWERRTQGQCRVITATQGFLQGTLFGERGWKADLRKQTEILNLQAVINLFLGQVRVLQEADYFPGFQVQEFIREYLNVLFYSIESRFEESEISSDEIDGFLENLNHFSSIDSVVERVINFITTVMNKQLQRKKMKDDEPIQGALQYILENYYENLTLEILSEQLGLNPSYFSSLFKQKTGMGFSDYLIHVRMEEAKELLSVPQRSIADTASEVGYRDSKHFSRQFKKHTGLSPGEYRKMYF